jgi:mRNA interferase MazF
MTSPKRGNVVLVHFPNSDLITFKKRPALVVQADGLATGIPQVVIAMITSNLSRRGHPSRVFVALQSPLANGSGLRSDSVVLTDNLATIRLTELAQTLGTIRDLSEVDSALRSTLGL